MMRSDSDFPEIPPCSPGAFGPSADIPYPIHILHSAEWSGQPPGLGFPQQPPKAPHCLQWGVASLEHRNLELLPRTPGTRPALPGSRGPGVTWGTLLNP